jgi:hypothetical protein
MTQKNSRIDKILNQTNPPPISRLSSNAPISKLELRAMKKGGCLIVRGLKMIPEIPPGEIVVLKDGRRKNLQRVWLFQRWVEGHRVSLINKAGIEITVSIDDVDWVEHENRRIEEVGEKVYNR